MNRRDLLQNLSLVALLPLLTADSAPAQTTVPEKPTAPPKHCDERLLTQCEAHPFESLPIRYSDAGAPTRQIMEGRVPFPGGGSEIIELHETTLAPGKMPHAPHRHPHAELLMVRTGTIEFQSDQPPVLVTAGGAAYCAPNQLHGFRNAGAVDATYFVLKIGAQPVCQK